MRWSGTSPSAAATERLGRALGAALEPLPRGGAVVALLGDLGAGKTVFASGLAHGLGVPEDVAVTSPTFTVARAYRGRVRVDHVDAYHLRGVAELEAAGFEDLGGDGRVLCVEWADRVGEALPADRLEVTITPVPVAAQVVDLGRAGEPDRAGGGAPASSDSSDALVDEPPRRVDVAATGPRSARVLERARSSLEGVFEASTREARA
jgi:tRNA threonylcarbamoyladenosine biosynthesis protein TsaE